MDSKDQLTLMCAPLSLVLRPALGGSIARFDYGAGRREKVPIFRGISPDEGGILDQGCFPLVPFVNRVRNGRFAFRGREIGLAPNLWGDPNPLHGTGWLACWDVEKPADFERVLRFRHACGEWPWAFHAAQHFALDANGLTLTLTCTNESDTAMPCGLGLHPYFRCTPETVLDTQVARTWTIDAATLPVDEVPAEGAFSLRGRHICGAGFDNGFGGWEGKARITDPSWPFVVTLSSRQAHFLHVYAPAEGGFFAAEPVTHANAALNAPEAEWPELGLRVLAPGETMSLSMRIEVTPRRLPSLEGRGI